MRPLSIVAMVCLAAGAACGGDSPSPAGPTSVPVSLVFRVYAPAIPVPVLGDYCFRNAVPGGIVAAVPSWAPVAERMKELEGQPVRYGLTLDAPVGQAVRVAIRDAFRCYSADPPPSDLWARDGLTVNGTTITRIEPLPTSQGDVPAFAFTVTTDGRVQ